MGMEGYSVLQCWGWGRSLGGWLGVDRKMGCGWEEGVGVLDIVHGS